MSEFLWWLLQKTRKFFWRLWFKFVHSAINVAIVMNVTGLLLGLCEEFEWSPLPWKKLCIGMFFVYNAVCELVLGRCLAMVITGHRYIRPRTTHTIFWFATLYTASFITCPWFFQIWFLGDILLINIIFFQTPCMIIRGNTMHGSITDSETTADIDEDTQTPAAKAA